MKTAPSGRCGKVDTPVFTDMRLRTRLNGSPIIQQPGGVSRRHSGRVHAAQPFQDFALGDRRHSAVSLVHLPAIADLLLQIDPGHVHGD